MRFLLSLLTLAALLLSTVSNAQIINNGDSVYFQTSLYSAHFNPVPEHNNKQGLVGVELIKPSNWLAGLALFSNSFDQPSQFLYVGRIWDIPNTDKQAYFKLAGGLLHGYKDEYAHKVPLNDYGIAPAILPTVGIKYGRLQSELVLFGTAGIAINVGFDSPFGG